MQAEEERRAILEKLRKIEALYAGAATAGEREAAGAARERIQKRLAALRETEPAREWRFSIDNQWSRQLMRALMRRYELEPYRYRGQRRTTIIARAPSSFIEKTLYPEFQELNKVLLKHLDELAEQIIREAISPDVSDIDENPGLPDGGEENAG